MPSKSPAQRLTDILENIDAIAEFTSGMTFAAYLRDRKTIYAVTRALEIISEASRRLPDALKQRHPTIDWPGVAAVGNIYRHEYDVVDNALVWHTLQHDLAPLRTAIAQELSQLEGPPPSMNTAPEGGVCQVGEVQSHHHRVPGWARRRCRPCLPRPLIRTCTRASRGTGCAFDVVQKLVALASVEGNSVIGERCGQTHPWTPSQNVGRAYA